MMQREFETLAGYEVTAKDYHDIIEPMYMALPNVSKTEFVKMIDRKRFALPTKAECIRKMRKLAESIADMVEHNGAYPEKEELNEMARAYAVRFHGFDIENLKMYYYFDEAYAIPDLKRGCTYPCRLHIGIGSTEFEKIDLTTRWIKSRG